MVRSGPRVVQSRVEIDRRHLPGRCALDEGGETFEEMMEVSDADRSRLAHVYLAHQFADQTQPVDLERSRRKTHGAGGKSSPFNKPTGCALRVLVKPLVLSVR